MKPRPNILLVMVDQLGARHLGAYGQPTIQTPHLDALARRGTVFASAYANCPICAPSRASMCTGRLVSATGAFDNGADFPASLPTFMHHLRRAGYEVVLSGKMHFLGPDQLHGFERRLTPELCPSTFAWTPDWTQGPVHNPGTAVDQLREAGVCDWSLQLDYDAEVQFRSLEFLRDAARRQQAGRPFLLCASYTHPHDPFIITRRWWDLYRHEQVEPPAAPAGPFAAMHPFNQWLQVHHMVDVYPPREADVRNARHAFYGMVSYVDAQIGALLAELERLGLAENTVVIFTSDHGEMLGEHGMWFKRTFFEPSLNVPLIVAGAGQARGGARVGAAVSLVDLLPTMLEFADLKDWRDIERESDGQSLGGLLRGQPPPPRDGIIAEYYSEGVLQPMRLAVNDRLKYVYVHEHEPLLFDLAQDPHELRNCIGDPAYQPRLARLQALVHDQWDPVVLRQRVLASQRHRRLIKEALAQDATTSWDIAPGFDARQQYVRNRDYQVLNAERRYPRVAGPDEPHQSPAPGSPAGA